MSLPHLTASSTPKNKKRQQAAHTMPSSYKLVSILLGIVSATGLILLIYRSGNIGTLDFGGVLRITDFSILIWTVVTFFSAMVIKYAGNYLNGFRYQTSFLMKSIGFTASVMLLVISNHIVLLLLSWLFMAFFMSRLIGVDKDWMEAKESEKLTLKYFLTGVLFLTSGVLLLAIYSNLFTLDELLTVIPTLPLVITVPAAVLIMAAAVVQSAMYPFHRWLLSAMTAPTPASALMHAGFVNGGGILLALFATLLVTSKTMEILFIIGGLTAIIAQFTKLLQVQVKHKLACSTIAQMGFMIMQCGLGFFNAAIAHLILHGFYKAYLFLSSGEEIAQTNPSTPLHIKIKPLQALIVFVVGMLGALLFVLWTGKGMQLDSSIFLTLIVAITVGQATYNIVKETNLSVLRKLLIMPILFVTGIGLYALLYNGTTLVMADLPMTSKAVPLSATHVIFGIIFLIGFFIMKLGGYKRLPWLYVQLMNLSQPHQKTVLTHKSKP